MSVLERIKPRQREVHAENIVVPEGYRVEAVVTGLNYPTSVAWDDQGEMVIAESAVPFGCAASTEVRVARRRGHRLETVIGLERLINDITFHRGRLYISQFGKISVLADGEVRDLITGLPSWGLHQNNSLAFGPDGRLYFGQGTVTNAGVIDSYTLNQLRPTNRLGDCDTPGAEVVLTGRNYTAEDLATGERRITGAYSPWGTATHEGMRIPGPRPGQAANGAIMSANADGSDLRVFAWGFRNPYGLAFGPDGRLYATNNGANRVPPRPIGSDPDTLWAVEEGLWYGWPDFFAGQPATDPAFKPPDRPQTDLLLANHAELLHGQERPPAPLVSFGLHAAPTKMDFSRQADFFPGQVMVAQFGSLLTPVEGLSAQPAQGHRVVRVDVAQGTVADLAVNRSGRPASLSDGEGGLERPIQARFGPDGALYIVDFGRLELYEDGWASPAGDGVIWRVVRSA